MASITLIPPEALEWLVGPDRTRVLLIGASSGYASLLARSGHSVTVVDSNAGGLAALTRQVPGIHVVAGKAESLPLDPSCFAVVLAIQNFHTFAPGLALGEWARVLSAEGRVALAYVARDDSVPWVKKLKRIVQYYLPHAMSSDYGSYSATALSSAIYFPRVEKRSFRLWIPSTRAQLQDNACQTLGADELEDSRRESMLAEIGELYDEYARVPEPLMLPYQIQCWRAEVDQSTLTSTLIPGDDGFSISF